jgi:3-oxoacyl-[acyl-carrier protein] reductase
VRSPPATRIAAYSTNDGFEWLDAATIDAQYAVNMRATMLLSVEFARQFTLEGGGRIISPKTGQALGPMPDGAYRHAGGRGPAHRLARQRGAVWVTGQVLHSVGGFTRQ